MVRGMFLNYGVYTSTCLNMGSLQAFHYRVDY